MLKIIITGPESCGKTTLARQLAAHFHIPLVEEYARHFFEKKQTPQYNEADLLTIAEGQFAAEKQAETALLTQFASKQASNLPNLILCDTDLLTIKIWAEEKYGRCDEWIIDKISNSKFQISNNQPPVLSSPHTSYFIPHTLYFLCSPEGIAWEADPLRENATDRERLFNIYEKNLMAYQKNYVILRGGIEARFEEARRLIEQ
jgi:nicotinamide riboside kinase